jgi:hypothetical protein
MGTKGIFCRKKKESKTIAFTPRIYRHSQSNRLKQRLARAAILSLALGEGHEGPAQFG